MPLISNPPFMSAFWSISSLVAFLYSVFLSSSSAPHLFRKRERRKESWFCLSSLPFITRSLCAPLPPFPLHKPLCSAARGNAQSNLARCALRRPTTMGELRRKEGYKQKGKGKERRWDDKDAAFFPSPKWKREGERYVLLIARCQKGDTKYLRGKEGK